MISPHGGKLVERIGKLEIDLPEIEINRETAVDLQNIAVGAYSPIGGFMNSEEFYSVIETGRLPNDVPWTIPIVLDSDKKILGEYGLKYNNRLVGKINIEDVFKPDKEKWVNSIFGTNSKKHPGVLKILNKKEFLLGGKITLFERIENKFKNYYLTPKETRVLFKEKNLKTIVGFQTRNVPHLGHEYVQKTALTFVDGLFINPVIGYKKPGDFKDDVIIKSYEVLMKNYYLKNSILAILPWEMKYAGPKEAIMHAIIRKNYGCTHFIVGRDHAGVGDFYDKYAAQKIFDEYPDIGIIPLFFREFFFCKKCGSIVNEKICPHDEKYRIHFSGTKIRKMLVEKKKPIGLMREEVIDTILSFENPFVS